MFNDDETPKNTQSTETKQQTIGAEELQAKETGDKGPKKFNDVNDLQAVYDVPVQVSAVLGRASMPVNQLLKLGRGAVIELDKRVGESIEIMVNNKLVAKGEVVVVDNHLGVTMTEIVKSDSFD
ncbi:MAG: flagellar motor switch protein FliN [Alphaproteobacteria bacterium CG_4_10_14_0_8_um_filter_37_21]|nr:MAG: flagellar motor switch protein FliN [Alphaproteobacteria bacterium CG_4_10_14_0_8_um_filter_37_21]